MIKSTQKDVGEKEIVRLRRGKAMNDAGEVKVRISVGTHVTVSNNQVLNTALIAVFFVHIN